MSCIISVKNLCKSYNQTNISVNALNNVSFHIQQGEFVAITGKSGSGKSTLMNILGCLDIADSGTFLLNNQNVAQLSKAELARIRNREIGFVFQNFCLLPQLTALENVALPLKYAGVHHNEREARARIALSQVGLTDRYHHLPSQLSGGQQQRVAIARAIVTAPPVILADEPTGNLDSQSGDEILALLASLWKEGKTVLMITHERVLPSFVQRSLKISDGILTE